MRVLIVTPEYPPHSGGGILRYYHALAPALVRQGCDVTVLVAAPTSPDFVERTESGVRVIPVPIDSVNARESGLAQFSAAPVFRRWLAGGLAAAECARSLGDFDAIETADFGLGFMPFVLAAGVPPVNVQLHGSMGQIADHEPPRPDRLLDHALMRLAELTVLPAAEGLQTYASSNASEWQRRLNRPVEICPPPFVSERVTQPDSPPSRDGVVVGRIQAWKSPAVLCEALEQTAAPGSIRWIGRDTPTAADGGSLSESLARQFPTVWGERVRPVGPLPYDETQRQIQSARFVVVPSTWDVFNLTAVEAMANGKVLICSTGAGASDLIDDAVNGFTFNAGDARGLASALTAVAGLDDRELREVGDAARATVERVLNPDAIAAGRVEWYTRLRRVRRHRPADWVGETFTGATGPVGTEFLDQLGVRDLSAYLGRRLRDRIATRVFKRA